MSRVDDFIMSEWAQMSSKERREYMRHRALRNVVKWGGVALCSMLVVFMMLWPSCSVSDDTLDVARAQSVPYQKREALEHCIGKCVHRPPDVKDGESGDCALRCANAINSVFTKAGEP